MSLSLRLGRGRVTHLQTQMEDLVAIMPLVLPSDYYSGKAEDKR